jgi:hypothetical protein
MPLDDGRMTETCCGNDIGRGEEELLRRRTHNCFVNPETSLLSDKLFLLEHGVKENLSHH